MIWVAYNEYGDLIAEAESEQRLLTLVDRLGYREDEVIYGVWTP